MWVRKTVMTLIVNTKMYGINWLYYDVIPVSKKYTYYFRTMIFMILFSQYLKNVTFPLPVYRRNGSNKGFGTVRVNLIQLFPVSYTCLPERDLFIIFHT